MQIRLIGPAASFDSNALKSSVNDFGIRFDLNDQFFALNSAMKITYPYPLQLDAVPVINPGATLAAGDTFVTVHRQDYRLHEDVLVEPWQPAASVPAVPADGALCWPGHCWC